jgi:F-type H+-transporting ATPase subunit b
MLLAAAGFSPIDTKRMLVASIDDGLLAAVVAPQAISVDFDATFLVVLALFVALTLFLTPVLFDPMLKLFEERERRIDGAKAQARKIDEKSASALAKYESEMAKARAVANAEREKLRAEGLRREQEILAAVRQAAGKTIDDGKRAAMAEASRVRASLAGEATKLARDLAERVLGREVQS